MHPWKYSRFDDFLMQLNTSLYHQKKDLGCFYPISSLGILQTQSAYARWTRRLWVRPGMLCTTACRLIVGSSSWMWERAQCMLYQPSACLCNRLVLATVIVLGSRQSLDSINIERAWLPPRMSLQCVVATTKNKKKDYSDRMSWWRSNSYIYFTERETEIIFYWCAFTVLWLAFPYESYTPWFEIDRPNSFVFLRWIVQSNLDISPILHRFPGHGGCMPTLLISTQQQINTGVERLYAAKPRGGW